MDNEFKKYSLRISNAWSGPLRDREISELRFDNQLTTKEEIDNIINFLVKCGYRVELAEIITRVPVSMKISKTCE